MNSIAESRSSRIIREVFGVNYSIGLESLDTRTGVIITSAYFLKMGFHLGVGPCRFKTSKIEQLLQVFKEKGYRIYDFSDSSGDIYLINENIAAMLFRRQHQIYFYCKNENSLAEISSFIEKHPDLFELKRTNDVIIDYMYLHQGGIYTEDIKAKNLLGGKIFPELYPNIDIEQLNKEFQDSRERILILYGEPGVGKTTFLRYVLASEYYTKIAYVKDPNVPKHGGFWPRISTDEYDLVIFDDLDNALEPREDNKDCDFINNLLSYSDGLIQHSCKVVITTNQPIQKIDSALLRPGRCFDFLVLEALSREQALNVWLNLFNHTIETFEQRFGNMKIITQAALMSEHDSINLQNQRRSYNKTGNHYYSVLQKIQDLGISTEKTSFGGFKK